MKKSVIDSIEIPPRVVFVNIKDGNVFFDCSPAEARFAIDEVKRLRERKITLPELRDKVEKMYSLISSCKKKIKRLGMTSEFTIDNLNRAFIEVEKHDYRVDGIFISTTNYADVRNWGKTVYDESTKGEMDIGVFGHIWGADIVVNNKIKKGVFYLVSLPEGRFGHNHEEFTDSAYLIKIKFGEKFKESKVGPSEISR